MVRLMSEKKISGQSWARFGLGFGAVLSIVGNVAHTMLVDSAVSLWLRVPFAVAWPVVLFIGIEVLVRVDWRRKFLDHLGRLVIWGPAGAVAAVVSYLHLHQLMTFTGESWFAALLGPLAIDGLMIGSTIALLAIRAATLAPAPALAPSVKKWVVGPDGESVVEAGMSDEQLDATVARWTQNTTQATEIDPEVFPAKVELEARVRRVRGGKPEQEQAVRLMLAGQRDAALELVSRATLDTYGAVARILRDDPMAEIGEKVNGRTVRPELVAIIRDNANRERAL
jgi:hypothetical protein